MKNSKPTAKPQSPHRIPTAKPPAPVPMESDVIRAAVINRQGICIAAAISAIGLVLVALLGRSTPAPQFHQEFHFETRLPLGQEMEYGEAPRLKQL
ncbi:hypothetical protein SAMN05444156_2153 [Verrucomicrobium sp. GAS474]|uniref:hypothetical protein n=1 Tax=Verrucomicrobium sp. GAS474 TaxID=1882831 RepID=UPI00087D4408|nr:hypothetical protein [Verrucomicrobium sp. GAS474]SDU13287.1 hypothetical protein SAMN05444156_2153 [Verrucomicrobium sp. GAS474]